MALFTSVSGNFAPIHSDLEHATQSHFGGRVAPASMLAAVALGLASMDTPPAASAGMVGMSWRFTTPVRPGDTIYVRWRMARKRLTENSRWGLAAWTADVINQQGEVCCTGEVSRLVARREMAVEQVPAAGRRRRRRRTAGAAAEAVAEAVAEAAVPEPLPQDLPVVEPAATAPAPAGRRRRRRRTSTGAEAAAEPARTPAPGAAAAPAAEGATATPRRRRRRRSGGGGNNDGNNGGNPAGNGGASADTTWGSGASQAHEPAAPASTISRVFRRLRGS